MSWKAIIGENKQGIEIVSDSGNTYQISIDGCTCPGYRYHNHCKHWTKAQEDGMLDKLERMELSGGRDVSQHWINMRVGSIMRYCKKNGIPMTEKLARKLEPDINPETWVEDLLAKRGG